MKIQILTASLLLYLVCAHNHYTCVFDSLNKDLHESSKMAKPDVSSINPKNGRLLSTVPRSPMRITMDSNTFNTLNPGLNGAPTTTTTNLAFIWKAMQVAAFFYMSRLQVYPLVNIFAPMNCTEDYFTPPNDQTFGISASDLHIYVTYTTDRLKTYGATGKSCKYFGDRLTSPPDDTLQLGRPTVGRIIFNTYALIDSVPALTNRLFQSIVATALHETLHILGMDSTLYPYWLDSNPNSARYSNTYTATTLSASGSIHGSRPSSTMFLITPNVRAWTRAFFNCSTAPGMLLQNEDSTLGVGFGGGSHWQRAAMYDQIMTGTALGGVKYFSGLTFSALRDMGWYTVDSSFNQTSNYGYQKDCPFLYNACYGGTNFEQFCDPVARASISMCSSSFHSKAICSNQAGLMADGCGLYGPYFNCIDPDSQNDGYKSFTSQVYGTSSFCVASTLGSVALPDTVQSRCYPYVCNPTDITFTIGTNRIICGIGQNGTVKTLSSMTGYLICPVYSQFCTNSRKTCPNWCSQNGYCMGGVCNCITGYYGDDCSQISCTSGTFYDSISRQCVTVCPSGYYQNSFNSACNKCANSCQQCYGEPTICTGCISTANNPQYNYSGNCFSACPNGTYAVGFNCFPCDSAFAFCGNCSINATNCTSCANFRFLSQPGYGTCLVNCPLTGTYSVSDVVNKICVATCASNLVLRNVGNNNNTCDYCANRTFKFISNSSCLSSCPNLYYANNVSWLCAACDSSCLTCFGGTAQSCISCSPTATMKYLLLQMCWSICPGGYYADDDAGTCQICPSNLNCGNCTYSNTTHTVFCTSCAFGYFFQSSTSTCLTGCNTNQFAYMGNNTCIGCNSNCLTCTGPASNQCRTCLAPRLFLNNVTGGFCLTSCPSVGFFNSANVTCVACDVSCLNCLGSGASACSSCRNGTYLSSGSCRMVCPPGKYPNDVGNACSSCDGSCTFCFGSTINNCTGCISGMVLFNFTCTLTCPRGYTINQWNVCYEENIKMLLTLLLLIVGTIVL